jgi:uncharacterized protein (DUF2147 family)
MKKYLFLFCVLVAIQLRAQEITHGQWWNEEKEGKIQFYEQGGKLYGKIVWLKDGDLKDKNNPDPKLRDKPLVGLTFLKGFTADGKDWKGGQIYDPKSGKTYSATIKWAGKNTLNVRGYIGVSLVGRTTRFTRVQE